MQLKTSNPIYFFDEKFRKQFNFEEYKSKDKPTLFFGIYRKDDIRSVLDHTSIKILWLAGIDASNDKTLHYIRKYGIDDKTIVIAESKWIENDLDRFEIKYKKIAMLNNKSKWEIEPLGKSVYWYNAGKSRYGKKIFKAVQDAIPDLDIIIINNNDLSHNEMADIYKKCFVGIRPIDHDGQSQTVAEMGLMGRKSIWNGNIPCSVSYKDTEDIIKQIKILRKGYDYEKVARETREFFEDNENKFKELIRDLCGDEEVKEMFK